MYDCRKFWGSTTFPFVNRLFPTFLVLALLLSSGLPRAYSQTDGDVPEPAATIDEPAQTQPEVSESEAEVAPEEEEFPPEQWKLMESVGRELDGNPEGENAADRNSEMFGEGARTLSDAIIRMVGGLSVVLALILFTYYGFRRFGKGIPMLAGRQLGQVIGQLHLTRDATLFYVRTGGRVLLISLSSGEVRTIAEFDESAFDGDLGAAVPHKGFEPGRFSDELKDQAAAYSGGGDVNDDDMAMLRSDIHRLQEYLQEEARDTDD